MIQKAINCISFELNQFMKHRFRSAEDVVVASNLVSLDGSVDIPSENKIVITMINIEREYTAYHNGSSSQIHEGLRTMKQPPVSLNFHILISSYFTGKNYTEALKFLSQVLYFFQGKSTFTSQNSPSLDPSISKLTMEIVNLDFKDLSSLWSMIGSRYLPSILYKIRMITFDSDTIVSLEHTVSETGNSAKGQ